MALIQVNYLSCALMRTVTVNVVLPVDKVSHREHDYLPVPARLKTLYLLHGMFGNCNDWLTGTSIQRLAEERDLCVVMPSGDNSYYVQGPLPFNDYGAFVGEELPRVMRSMFPLSGRREDTFIAGLSMGGYGALRNGMRYAQTFGGIAAISSALTVLDPASPPIAGDKAVFGDLEVARGTDKNYEVAYENLRSRVESGEEKMPRIYLGCGTEDPFIEGTRALRARLEADGVEVAYSEEPGGHDWDLWESQIRKVVGWLPLGETKAGLGSGSIA
jgi:putative tributyrin esterase